MHPYSGSSAAINPPSYSVSTAIPTSVLNAQLRNDILSRSTEPLKSPLNPIYDSKGMIQGYQSGETFVPKEAFKSGVINPDEIQLVEKLKLAGGYIVERFKTATGKLQVITRPDGSKQVTTSSSIGGGTGGRTYETSAYKIEPNQARNDLLKLVYENQGKAPMPILSPVNPNPLASSEDLQPKVYQRIVGTGDNKHTELRYNNPRTGEDRLANETERIQFHEMTSIEQARSYTPQTYAKYKTPITIYEKVEKATGPINEIPSKALGIITGITFYEKTNEALRLVTEPVFTGLEKVGVNERTAYRAFVPPIIYGTGEQLAPIFGEKISSKVTEVPRRFGAAIYNDIRTRPLDTAVTIGAGYAIGAGAKFAIQELPAVIKASSIGEVIGAGEFEGLNAVKAYLTAEKVGAPIAKVGARIFRAPNLTKVSKIAFTGGKYAVKGGLYTLAALPFAEPIATGNVEQVALLSKDYAIFGYGISKGMDIGVARPYQSDFRAAQLNSVGKNISVPVIDAEGNVVMKSIYAREVHTIPAQVEISTKLRKFFDLPPIRELSPIGNELIYYFRMPRAAKLNSAEPFFVVERGPRTTAFHTIKGSSEPIDILNQYPKISAIDRKMLETLAHVPVTGLPIEPILIKKSVMQSPLDYLRNTKDIDFKEISKKEFKTEYGQGGRTLGIAKKYEIIPYDVVSHRGRGFEIKWELRKLEKPVVRIREDLRYKTKNLVAAHETIHAKTPAFLSRLNPLFPYRIRPTEILAYGLEDFFAKRGFKGIEKYYVEPTAYKHIPQMFNKESSSFFLGESISARLKLDTKPSIKLSEKQPIGRLTSRTRTLTVMNEKPTLPESPVINFEGETAFHAQNKPNSRASGKILTEKEYLIVFKEPIGKVVDIDKMSFEELELKANAPEKAPSKIELNQQQRQQLKLLQKQIPKTLPKLDLSKIRVSQTKSTAALLREAQTNIPKTYLPGVSKSELQSQSAIQSPIMKEELISRPVSRETTRELTIEKMSPLARERSSIMSRELDRTMEKALERSLEKTMSRELPRNLEKEKSLQRERLLERLNERTLQKEKIIPRVPPISPPMRISLRTPRLTPIGIAAFGEGKTRGGRSYQVTVYRKYRPVKSIPGLSKEAALDIGTANVLKDLSATFGISKSSAIMRDIQTGGEFKAFSYKFRRPTAKSRYRGYGDIFIQRSTGKGGRLSTAGELAEIRQSRYNKILRSIQ